MGINYTVYCEAKTEYGWVNIDFWQRAPSGQFSIVPIATGRSVLETALRWNHLLYRLIPWTELSPQLQEIYPSYPDQQTWYTVDYSLLKDLNFEYPEHCGYISKDIVRTPNPEERDDLITEAFENGQYYDVFTFSKLSNDAQQGFTYVEHSNPYGQHVIMKELLRQIRYRIEAYSKHSVLPPVRIVIRLD